MDHIRRLIVPEVQEIRTPFIVDTRFIYDNLGFWGFPERVSFKISDLWASEPESELDNLGKLSFLQQWLYFGFAHEVFGRIVDDTPTPLLPQQLIRKADLTIDSTLLWSAGTAWMAVEEYGSKEIQEQRMEAILAVRREVRKVVEAVLNADQSRNIRYLAALHHAPYLRDCDDNDFPIGYRIVMSICLLGEAIDAAVETIYANPWEATMWTDWPMSLNMHKLYLRRTGLCKLEAKTVTRDGPASHSVLAYASLTSQFASKRSHVSCSDVECRAITRPTGPPAHVQAGCQCELVSLSDMDQSRLCEIIKDGTIPMLTVEDLSIRKTMAKLSVTEFRSSEKSSLCVAISHVWSDMLGNPLNNAMPACQLLRLQKKVNHLADIWHSQWDFKPTIVGFWIDTVCVPHNSEVKNLALAQMYNIYNDCSAVLVLDKLIQSTSPEIGWHTCLWQIYTSAWDRRLWTLQEGILNEHTFFALDDDFWTVENLINCYDMRPHLMNVAIGPYREFLRQHRSEQTPKLRNLTPHFMDPVYRMMRFSIRETRRTMRDPEKRSLRLLRQLAWRSTSYSSDESICLAILTGFDISKLLEIPAEDRLAAVMQTLSPCPAFLIFCIGPRYETEGCRWIPKSILNQGSALPTNYNVAGTPSSEGLLVELPSMVPKKGSVVFTYDGTGDMYSSRTILVLTVADEEFQVTTPGYSLQEISEFFFGEHADTGVLLLSSFPNYNKVVEGCICSLRKVEDSVVYVKLVTICEVRARRKVYNLPERKLFFGFAKEEDQDKPLLTHDFLEQASMTSEAEIFQPMMFCVG